MPVFLVTDPQSGRKVKLTGDSAPTEQELNEIFSNLPPAQQDPSFGQQALGALENVGSLVSGAVAEPLAGLAGIAQSLNPFAEEGAGAQAIESTREALTFKPRTETGQAQQQAIGEALAPVGEAITGTEKFLGDTAFDLTGSPAIAAAAKSLPTAALEVLGFKGAKRLTGPAKTPTKKAITKAIVESAPEIEQIKNVSRQVYKEIDQSGVKVKQNSINNLINNIENKTKKAGLDPRVTQKAAGALDVLRDSKGLDQGLGEIDTLRSVAQGVASQLDTTEKALGNIMIAEIDDFLDNLQAKDLIGGTEKAAATGKKFKAARKLWGRARRAELLTEAISRGEDVAAGAEAGIRNEFNRILRNKKLSKFIPADERAIMRDVVKGNFAQNLTRLVGKVGLSIDRSPNVFGSIVAGGGLGTVVGGTTGALVVPVIGTISKQIAQKLTRNRASFAQAITRAGTNGERIAKAYLTAVPKAKRSIQDLSDLLSDPKINIDDLEFIANQTVKDALELAKGKRAINLAVGAGAGTIPEREQQP